jgi:hypothetical protein
MFGKRHNIKMRASGPRVPVQIIKERAQLRKATKGTPLNDIIKEYSMFLNEEGVDIQIASKFKSELQQVASGNAALNEERIKNFKLWVNQLHTEKKKELHFLNQLKRSLNHYK